VQAFKPAKFDGDTAVVVLGHGSRAAEAQKLLAWVAEGISRRIHCPVLAASLQFNEPTLQDCCRLLAAQGARRIIVAPYFLFEGNHMQRDIPSQLEVLAGELSNVELVLSPPLGADERLVEVMVKRIVDTGCRLLEKARLQVQEESGQRRQVRQEAGAASATLKESFALIDELLGVTDTDEPEYQIRRRVIHATGDLSLGGLLKLSPGAISAGVEAVKLKANILCDVKMVAAGIEPTAARLGIRVACAIADEATAQRALAGGITRSAAGMQRLIQRYGLEGALVVIGNAPTALFEVLRLAQDKGARPALVIGVPVGFIGAAESKDALSKSGLPYITLPGNRGGSSIAAAITNAMMKLGGRQPGDGAAALRQG